MTDGIVDSRQNKPGSLRIDELSVALLSNGRNLHVLEDITIVAAPGQITAVMGRSGSGKSTLLNVVAGFTSPLKGTVEFAGEGIPALRQRGLFAYQNQKPLLLPWLTIRANLKIVGEILPHPPLAAELVLASVGLSDSLDHYPTELSGGMFQRVAFARALCARPQLLLLDEPFSALDEVTRLSMYAVLQKHVREGAIACLLVTHDVTEALRLADHCVIINGRPARNHKELAVPADVRSRSDVALENSIFNEIVGALA